MDRIAPLVVYPEEGSDVKLFLERQAATLSEFDRAVAFFGAADAAPLPRSPAPVESRPSVENGDGFVTPAGFGKCPLGAFGPTLPAGE